MSLDLTRTGVEVIDNLLYAIETASDQFHNSKNWDLDCDGQYFGLKGTTPEEWISNAALDIAKAFQNKG